MVRRSLGRAGYTLIDARDLDETVEIASGFLGDDSWASIEVRPVVEYEMPG